MKTALLALLVAFVSVSRMIWFMPGLGNNYYLLLIAVLLLLLFKGRREIIRLDILGLTLIGTCFFSILFNDVPSFFRPWMRLGLLGVVIALVGPFLQNAILQSFRINLFWDIQLFYVATALVSFLGRFIGISRMQGNFWCGITNHSMLMGIVAGNAGVFLLMLIIAHDKLTPKLRWTLGLFLLLCLLMMIGAASRSCIIAFLIGGLVAVFVFMKQYRTRIAKIALVGCVVLYILSPVLTRYSKGIQQKNHGAVMDLNVTSRRGLWDKGWQTFKDNPFMGVGFSAVDIDTAENTIDTPRKGQIEPGSSWLAVLSMTGLAGGIAIVLILNRSRSQLRKVYAKNTYNAAVLYGLLVFYCIHMCGEGYIFAGGSMACFNFWLLLGTIEAVAAEKIHDKVFIEQWLAA